MSEKETYQKIASIISQLTGVPEEELVPGAVLDEDLGIDFRQELPAVIASINADFEIDLKAPFIFETLGENFAMSDFVALVHEEAEL